MAGDLKFPANFLWGTATSPTQVEGHVVNEWTDYVAADGGHCRVACDHYHRYEEDVDWMGQLGVNAYRMGIEWSRLQDAPFAPLNPKELERYVHLLDCLKAANITPMVVLHHFSNPPWIAAQADLTLSEFQKRCLEHLKVSIGITALWHRLEQLGLSYKKNDARRRARSA
jgi:beta-glucosidase